MPVSTCREGSGSSEPSFSRLNWLNTLFQISITCGSSPLTSVLPGTFFLASSLRQSTCISVQGPQGPVSPISQKLSFFPNERILSSPRYFFHSAAASSSLGVPSFVSPPNMVTYI